MIRQSGQTGSGVAARHYECRSPVANATTPLAYSGTRRNATEASGTQRSATVSAKNPSCKCGETREEAFARKRMKSGRIGFQHQCKSCMVAYHRAWRSDPEGRAKMRAGVTASKRRYPEKEQCRRAYRRALDRGDLTLGPCYAASPGCRGAIEGHHHDYTKPLAVTWTCRRHHRALDLKRRESAA